MKNIINNKKITTTFLLVIFMLSFSILKSQNVEQKPLNIDSVLQKLETLRNIDKMPEFPGGEEAMISFISSKMKYPKKAKKNGIEGKVIIHFMIKADGDVVALSAVQKVSPEIDKEAIRIVNKMPNWKPAEYQGKPVTILMNLPLNFLLEVK